MNLNLLEKSLNAIIKVCQICSAQSDELVLLPYRSNMIGKALFCSKVFHFF